MILTKGPRLSTSWLLSNSETEVDRTHRNKMTRQQVIISGKEIAEVISSASETVEAFHRGLTEACSKLSEGEAVSEAQ